MAYTVTPPRAARSPPLPHSLARMRSQNTHEMAFRNRLWLARRSTWRNCARNRGHDSRTRGVHLKSHAHFVVPDYDRLKKIGPPGGHIASRYASDKFCAFCRIDNDIAWSLGNRLVVRPLQQLFPSRIAKDKIVFATVAENKVHRLPGSIDQQKVGL